METNLAADSSRIHALMLKTVCCGGKFMKTLQSLHWLNPSLLYSMFVFT